MKHCILACSQKPLLTGLMMSLTAKIYIFFVSSFSSFFPLEFLDQGLNKEHPSTVPTLLSNLTPPHYLSYLTPRLVTGGFMPWLYLLSPTLTPFIASTSPIPFFGHQTRLSILHVGKGLTQLRERIMPLHNSRKPGKWSICRGYGHY